MFKWLVASCSRSRCIGCESPVCPRGFLMLSKRSRRFQKCFCVLSFASKKPSKTQYVWCSGASTLISLISLHSFLPRHVQETFLLCVLPSCHMCATIIQFDTNTICVNSVHVSSKHVLTRPAHASQTPPPSLRHLAAAPPVAIKPQWTSLCQEIKSRKTPCYFNMFQCATFPIR